MSDGDSCGVIKAGWYLGADWVQQCAITTELNFHLRANAGRIQPYCPDFYLCLFLYCVLKNFLYLSSIFLKKYYNNFIGVCFILVTVLPNSISQDGAITIEGDSTVCEDPGFLSQVWWFSTYHKCDYMYKEILCLVPSYCACVSVLASGHHIPVFWVKVLLVLQNFPIFVRWNSCCDWTWQSFCLRIVFV